jgi:hypothetical protein
LWGTGPRWRTHSWDDGVTRLLGPPTSSAIAAQADKLLRTSSICLECEHFVVGMLASGKKGWIDIVSACRMSAIEGSARVAFCRPGSACSMCTSSDSCLFLRRFISSHLNSHFDFNAIIHEEPITSSILECYIPARSGVSPTFAPSTSNLLYHHQSHH